MFIALVRTSLSSKKWCCCCSTRYFTRRCSALRWTKWWRCRLNVTLDDSCHGYRQRSRRRFCDWMDVKLREYFGRRCLHYVFIQNHFVFTVVNSCCCPEGPKKTIITRLSFSTEILFLRKRLGLRIKLHSNSLIIILHTYIHTYIQIYIAPKSWKRIWGANYRVYTCKNVLL